MCVVLIILSLKIHTIRTKIGKIVARDSRIPSINNIHRVRTTCALAINNFPSPRRFSNRFIFFYVYDCYWETINVRAPARRAHTRNSKNKTVRYKTEYNIY